MSERTQKERTEYAVEILQAELARLVLESGVDYATIKLEVASQNPTVWTCYVHGGVHEQSDTLETALQKSVEKAAPFARVRALRENAAKALREAEELEKSLPTGIVCEQCGSQMILNQGGDAYCSKCDLHTQPTENK